MLNNIKEFLDTAYWAMIIFILFFGTIFISSWVAGIGWYAAKSMVWEGGIERVRD